jgi:hypothetical protein
MVPAAGPLPLPIDICAPEINVLALSTQHAVIIRKRTTHLTQKFSLNRNENKPTAAPSQAGLRL